MPGLVRFGAAGRAEEASLMFGNADRGGRWRKSSECGMSPNCVEVAMRTDGVSVRDSKDPAGPVLEFTLAEWAAFVAGVHGGEFEVSV